MGYPSWVGKAIGTTTVGAGEGETTTEAIRTAEKSVFCLGSLGLARRRYGGFGRGGGFSDDEFGLGVVFSLPLEGFLLLLFCSHRVEGRAFGIEARHLKRGVGGGRDLRDVDVVEAD